MARGTSRTGSRADDSAPLLDEAANAFDEGRFDDVVSLAERALQLEPRSAPARHFRAAGLLEAGRGDEALQEYERALRLAPGDPEILLGMADLLIRRPGEDRTLVERGLALCEKGRKLARKADDPDLEFEFLLLEGTARNQLGECSEAIEVLDEALAVVPDSADAALERAIALFELCRFDEAQRALRKVIQQSPDEAWAHHYQGLIAERRKDAREAKKQFTRAQALSPDEFPPPVRLDDDDFDRAVEDAIAQLPAHVKQYLENATIAVEPIPADEDLKSSDPPLSPSILGVFRGTPVGERSVTNAFDHFPASIVLYQRNLERFARNREELIEQIGITLMHEVGHLIGLDEHDLWERGLE
jgi:predicted Zn-dependent protease with MMP-like domain